MSYSSAKTVSTVVQREIQVSLKSKAILISLAIMLVAMVAAIGLVGFFSDKEADPKTLAVVGMSAEPFEQATDSAVTVTVLDHSSDAEARVKDGDADAAVVKTDNGVDFVFDNTPDPALHSLVEGVISSMAQNQALSTLGISPEEFQKAMPASTVTMVSLDEQSDDDVNYPAIVTVMIAVGMMCFFVMLFAGNIGSRVTEEKSSRVVEIILASARPTDFLAGKIIANTLFGVVASTLIMGVGAVGLSLTGLAKDVDFDYGTLLLMLVAFVLGMLLFGSLYAAAGSLVSRTEDLQSTQAPILLLVFAMIYAPFFGWQFLDSTVMTVLAWIPPTSLSVAPLQLAAGNMNLIQVLGSFGVTLVATVLIIMLVARIYKNAILHNGQKMSWKTAIAGK
ncbi:ABC transporter permease [Corynebacterium sp. 320]|uniref:ABC transporter permease n=1 Tax=Corynebacterium TaxID=1716 RepID=UPI00125CCD3A|nr:MULTISPECIES: ABC transporter permease [Corynebacterium]KAB1501329.1 ABC transporter permease [Corynebacterium sp. 320]KAB1551498.1 ABC transporter permease [Corynebacterium sp. 321]KAB1551674.1 ABC transporter permease [Corynebacterium sp. 319]KAB3525694.1 ABC transporter permease [Corynebacterium sp. 250]KAB3538664.1 ABC transporter permease [Corynebacterium sp. 366]